MIVNIPHDGHIIPREYANFIGEPTYMGDYGATFLYNYDWATVLSFPIDRIICDVERFIDKDIEPMEKVGMGVCYTRNANNKPLRIVTDEQRQEIIDRYYVPYHEMFEKQVNEELNKYGKCFIIDGHTFSTYKRPYEQDSLRPEICIGYDESQNIGQIAYTYLQTLGYNVSVNRPFSGSIRPLATKGNKQVESVMFEVRQDMVNNKTRTDLEDLALTLSNLVYKNSMNYINSR